jgi:hypothetical protein
MFSQPHPRIRYADIVLKKFNQQAWIAYPGVDAYFDSWRNVIFQDVRIWTFCRYR